MKLLLYCTKRKPCLYKDRGIEYALSNIELVDSAFTRFNPINGKVVGECDYEVEKMGLDTGEGLVFDNGFNKESQLDLFEIAKYVGNNYYYAIHIKNLNIYKSPRELSSYSCVRAPQNMQYVYTCYDKNEYILISIQPQWLCKILNGEKTIEVRKKVLKGMLENER